MLTRQSADPGKTLDFNRPSLGKAVQRLCSDRACNTQSSGALCRRIKKRQPVWSELVSLLQHAKVLGPYAELKMDANAVRDHRTLLTDPTRCARCLEALKQGRAVMSWVTDAELRAGLEV